jgi:hypothetical protein
MTGQQLIDLYASIFLWVNVIVVGFAVRFLGDGVKYLVTTARGHVSSRSASRRTKADEIRQRMADRLRSDPHAQVLYSLSDIRYRITATIGILFGVFVVLFADIFSPDPARIFLFLAGAAFVLAGGNIFATTNERQRILLNAVDGIPFDKKPPPSVETLS